MKSLQQSSWLSRRLWGKQCSFATSDRNTDSKRVLWTSNNLVFSALSSRARKEEFAVQR